MPRVPPGSCQKMQSLLSLTSCKPRGLTCISYQTAETDLNLDPICCFACCFCFLFFAVLIRSCLPDERTRRRAALAPAAHLGGAALSHLSEHCILGASAVPRSPNLYLPACLDRAAVICLPSLVECVSLDADLKMSQSQPQFHIW